MRALIAEAGHDVTYLSPEDEGWERALPGDAELVAAAGGDGTVTQALLRLAGSEVPLALLPLGSANNVARSLGIGDADPGRLVESWSRGRTARYSVGEVAAGGEDVRFAETFGGGLFAESILRADDDPGGDDKVELGLRVLRELVDELPALEWRLEVDGVDRSGRFVAVEAMLIGSTGPGVPLAPDASPYDGRLEVVCVTEEGRSALAAYLDGRLAGAEPEPPALDVTRASAVRMHPPADCPLRVDDDVWSPPADRRALARAGRLWTKLLLPGS